ncbi:MAG: nickel pincer cofactor biosynthesis protein LarB [Candidatus Jordarchaeaceae archaeon]
MSQLRSILEKFSAGKISIEEAENLLRSSCILEIDDFVKFDLRRELRKGVPEVVFASGKRPEDLVKIVKSVLSQKTYVLISRANEEQTNILKRETLENFKLEIFEKSGTVRVSRKEESFEKTGGKVGIITAGTSDIPVADEAKVIAESMGCEVLTSYDVGIAGLHRVFPPLSKMMEAEVDSLIVVAGMEGTLPSIVASLVNIPVIGVPTSTGYGFGGKGLGALITMLQSCVAGLSVVNIDNGFGAGATAALIANRVARYREKLKTEEGKKK